jgi:hypothetical protein
MALNFFIGEVRRQLQVAAWLSIPPLLRRIVRIQRIVELVEFRHDDDAGAAVGGTAFCGGVEGQFYQKIVAHR